MDLDTDGTPTYETEPIGIAGAVSVLGPVTTHEEAADYGSYTTWVFVGTEQPQSVLGHDDHRVRAQLVCSGTGPVFVGSEAQCMAVARGVTPGPGTGYLLASGAPALPVTHKQPLWIVPDGTHSATVSVAIERREK